MGSWGVAVPMRYPAKTLPHVRIWSSYEAGCQIDTRDLLLHWPDLHSVFSANLRDEHLTASRVIGLAECFLTGLHCSGCHGFDTQTQYLLFSCSRIFLVLVSQLPRILPQHSIITYILTHGWAHHLAQCLLRGWSWFSCYRTGKYAMLSKGSFCRERERIWLVVQYSRTLFNCIWYADV